MTKQKKTVRTLGSAFIALVLSSSVVAGGVSNANLNASAAEYSQKELYQEGYELNVEMEEEGAVLFQNNDNALPLSSDVQVDLYGYVGYNIIHGGGGSGKGKWDADCLQEKAAFELAGLDVNDELWAWMGSASGANLTQESWVADRGGVLVNGNTYDLPEVPVTTYRKSKSVAKPGTNVAIVTFGRQGHEGAELPMHMDEYQISTDLDRTGSYDRTYLDPTETELELLDYLKNECKYEKIIILINSSNVMAIDEYLEYSDACLWIGGPGENGLVGVGEVLLGKDSTGAKISPSGRTSDTWMSSFYSNPVFYNNGGGTTYSNVSGGGWSGANYNQYEEGIFMGYRWYETAYADKLVLEGTNGVTYDFYNDYEDIVTMPFGGGLSYTTFDWEVVSSDINLVAGGSNEIKVKVTNSGDYPGKDVVQIYVNAPYNEGGIDKAEVVLAGFAKTGRLKPGESGIVTITFETDDLASYDYLGYKATENGTDYNGNAKWGGYVLEAGEYEFRVQSDAHTQKTEAIKATLGEDIIYDGKEGHEEKRASDSTTAYNKINDVNATDGTGMIYMQRSTMAEDWEAITNYGAGRQDEIAQVALGDALASGMNTAQQGHTTVSLQVPYQDTYKTITLTYGYQGATESVGNTGLNYWGKKNDDQEYKDAIANVGQSTTSYTPETRFVRNGEIKETDAVTTDTDEATSYGWDEIPWTDSRWDDWVDQGTLEDYVSLQGQNWSGAFSRLGLSSISASDGPGEAGTGGKEGNTWWCSEVVMASTWNLELIERVGKAYGKQCVRTGITSCYGPAMNTHRSPFGGRNFEYYSEDGYLAGMMCVAETSGIQSEGVGTFNKHFMLNDLDGGRSGQIDFCNEQALREIYLRAWEYSMKSDIAPMSGMMASLNRIGITWANRGVYIGIIREEFDWHGLTISDGMDGVNYSGEVKATFSGIACLLWSNTVGSTSDAERNDGSIFVNENVSADSINDYYGVYMLREIMKMRLWYDTHIISKGVIFDGSDYEALDSVNYEMMDVSNLTKNENGGTVTPGDDEKSFNPAPIIISVVAVAIVAVVLVVAMKSRKKD